MYPRLLSSLESSYLSLRSSVITAFTTHFWNNRDVWEHGCGLVQRRKHFRTGALEPQGLWVIETPPTFALCGAPNPDCPLCCTCERPWCQPPALGLRLGFPLYTDNSWQG